MANFRCERIFVMLDSPVPGLNHLKAFDVEEFAGYCMHIEEDDAASLNLTPLLDFAKAPYEQPQWFEPTAALETIRGLIALYQKWLKKEENPYGMKNQSLEVYVSVLTDVDQLLSQAQEHGRFFYFAVKDLG